MTSLAVSPSKAPFHCPYSRCRLLKHQFTAFTRGTASKSAIFTAFPQAHGRAEAAAAAGEGGPPANEFTPATKAMWGEVYTLTYRRVDAAADGAAGGAAAGGAAESMDVVAPPAAAGGGDSAAPADAPGGSEAAAGTSDRLLATLLKTTLGGFRGRHGLQLQPLWVVPCCGCRRLTRVQPRGQQGGRREGRGLARAAAGGGLADHAVAAVRNSMVYPPALTTWSILQHGGPNNMIYPSTRWPQSAPWATRRPQSPRALRAAGGSWGWRRRWPTGRQRSARTNSTTGPWQTRCAADGETSVILLHPTLPWVGASIGMERGRRQQTDSLAGGHKVLRQLQDPLTLCSGGVLPQEPSGNMPQPELPV